MRNAQEYRVDELRKLIDKHGIDVVARATELKPSTLCEYANNSARKIPLGKLVAAQRTLKANNYETK